LGFRLRNRDNLSGLDARASVAGCYRDFVPTASCGILYASCACSSMDRAPDFESVGWGFESLQARQGPLPPATHARRLFPALHAGQSASFWVTWDSAQASPGAPPAPTSAAQTTGSAPSAFVWWLRPLSLLIPELLDSDFWGRGLGIDIGSLPNFRCLVDSATALPPQGSATKKSPLQPSASPASPSSVFGVCSASVPHALSSLTPPSNIKFSVTKQTPILHLIQPVSNPNVP
jgi:hypothetical protein